MSNMIRVASYFTSGGSTAPDISNAARLQTQVSRSAPAPSRKMESHPAQDQLHFHNQDGFDEGIVHSHGWARNG